jgi:hypothetical protein
MTAPFVTELRTSDEVVKVGGTDGDTLHLRVQVAELWDTLRIDASPMTSVEAVKKAALGRFFPDGESLEDFVVKLRGFEILDESSTLATSGAKDGSTLLVARRRRRPVK